MHRLRHERVTHSREGTELPWGNARVRSLFGLSEGALLVGIGLLVGGVVVVLATAAWRNPLLPRLAWRNVPRRPGYALLVGLLVLAGVVALALGWAAWRNPLLPRLAWRNVPRRPGFAVLITLGLTIGTVILSSAFTTGDTMSQSVRTVVAGVLGSADEVAFIPSADQRSGWDLAQSIATGALLTGVTGYFPSSDVQQIEDLVRDDPRVAAVVPVIVDQVPAAGDGQAFAARLNIMGVPPQEALTLESATTQSTTTRSVTDLAPDEVYINTEAAAALGITNGQTVHAYNFPFGADATWTVKDVTWRRHRTG